MKTTEVVTGGDRYLQAKRVGWTADAKPALGAPLAMGTAQQLPSGDPG